MFAVMYGDVGSLVNVERVRQRGVKCHGGHRHAGGRRVGRGGELYVAIFGIHQVSTDVNSTIGIRTAREADRGDNRDGDSGADGTGADRGYVRSGISIRRPVYSNRS